MGARSILEQMTDRMLQVTYRNLDSSEGLNRRATQRFQKLKGLHDRISACHVVIDAPNRAQRGQHFTVRIELRIPGRRIIVQHGSAADPRSENAYTALGDAFDRVRRSLVQHRQKGHRRHNTLAPGVFAA